ncbi:hypothetical protein HDU67_010133 [Dinochytrium kinnereticum]|nr:hypothetical protein HDU67_010133 [Dinochytrium kinnereticum]
MPPSPHLILRATTDPTRQSAFTIRIKGYDQTTEFDTLDETSTHLIGLIPHIPSSSLPTTTTKDGTTWTVVGAARAFVDDKGVGRIGRVAVVREASGAGVGAGLVMAFYEKLGYVAVGDVFDEDGTPHITMIKTF